MMKLRTVVTLFALLFMAQVVMAAEVKGWEEFAALDAAEQEKIAKKKAAKKGEYYFCKVGKYQVSSDKDAVSAYKWGLILDDFTEELLDEGVVPKKASRQGNPLVYILKDREAYQKALSDYSKGEIEAGWSVGMFVRMTAKPALFAFDYSSAMGGAEKEAPKADAKDGKKEDGKKEEDSVMSTVLHECTHQMVYYHIGSNIPTWFNEGIATNMEKYDFALNCRANLYNAKYVNNRADGAAIISKEGKLKKFSVLFDIGGQQWSSASEDQAQINYASTWASVNYMLTTRKGRKAFLDIQNALKNGGENAVRKMFSDKVLSNLDEQVKEYVDKVLMPCCQYGRQARESLNGGDKEKSERILKKMKEEYPDNLELKFYENWLAILNNQEPAKAVAEIKKLLAETDFFHPEANFVLALGSKAAGNQSEFTAYLKKAQESNSKHQGTLDLAKEAGAK